MKASTKKMIDLLCSIGIFVLIVFIVLPPLMKLFLPDGDNYENTVDLKLLSCIKTDVDGSIKEIKTHYKNDTVQKVEITYSNVTDTTQIDEKDYYNINGVEHSDTDTNIEITITPNQNNQNRLGTMFQKIDKQRSIYEDGDYNYTCNITKQ